MICPVRGQPPPPGDVGVDGCPGDRVVVLLVGGPDVVTRALDRVWASALITFIRQLSSSAVNQSIGFTISYHNHGEGPY